VVDRVDDRRGLVDVGPRIEGPRSDVAAEATGTMRRTNEAAQASAAYTGTGGVLLSKG
jgi:hypothetical protein